MKLKDKRNETVEHPPAQIRFRAQDTSANHSPRPEEIRLRAHEIYIERGGVPGNELDDWLQAERELGRAAPSKANGSSIKAETQ